MSKYILDFEEPIRILEQKLVDLKNSSNLSGMDLEDSISSINYQIENEKSRIYNNLTRWEKIQLSRHPMRPHTVDYIPLIMNDWTELHGDRKYADDPSIITGIGKINNVKCVLIGQEKGRDTKDKLYRNFGMVRPEGYRKAKRIMEIAEKFKLPIITFIDTPGAYPGIGAEERGQAQAIADNLFFMSRIKVPIISIVIGEGASGGALAIGLSDKILCLEHTWYSVISPEGCASILFRDTSKSIEAANSMKVTSNDLHDMGIADEIINEPLGGAHHDIHSMSKRLKSTIIKNIDNLLKLTSDNLVESRLNKYNKIGKLN
tara:strand:+ start:7104 stop:8057 length:954 start_codon:yes stop_codon:yes gene_type:complete